MYGLVNAGLRDLVIAEHGEETWAAIAARARLPSHPFVAMRTYDDDVTTVLVGAASEVLGVPAEILLERFGEHWMRYTAATGYGALLDLCGRSFAEFLEQLDSLHGRVKLAMPELNPPVIMCTRIDDAHVRVRYSSARVGFAPLVVGLLRGLGHRFDTVVSIEHVTKRAVAGYDEFLVAYESRS